MGVLMASSRCFNAAKWPCTGVLGSSDGSGEKGLLLAANDVGLLDVQIEMDAGRAGMAVGGRYVESSVYVL